MITIPDPYIMPRINDIIDLLGNTNYLSKMDLEKGFHQVPVRHTDRPIGLLSVPVGESSSLGVCHRAV